MSEEKKSLTLIALFIIAMMFYLAQRKRKPVEETSVKIGDPSRYGEIGVPLGAAETLDTALVRICAYEKTSLQWILGDPCPPTYAGQGLLSDTVQQKLPYQPTGGDQYYKAPANTTGI